MPTGGDIRVLGGSHYLPRRVQSATSVLDHVRVGKEPQHQTAEQAGNAVGVNDPERVVNLAEWSHLGQVVPCRPDDRRVDDANKDGAPTIDPTGARRDATRPQ